jgi:hypothetical protein
MAMDSFHSPLTQPTFPEYLPGVRECVDSRCTKNSKTFYLLPWPDRALSAGLRAGQWLPLEVFEQDIEMIRGKV